MTVNDITVDGENLTVSGDVDGVDFTGSVERFGNRVVLTVEPEVLGVGLSPRKAIFSVRELVPLTGGASETQYEMVPITCGPVCSCTVSSGACSPDDCDVGANCAGGSGVCRMTFGGDVRVQVMCIVSLFAGIIVISGVMCCQRQAS